GCGKSARPVLCGGRWATIVPTATHRRSGRPSGRPSDGLKPVAYVQVETAVAGRRSPQLRIWNQGLRMRRHAVALPGSVAAVIANSYFQIPNSYFHGACES